MLNSLQLKKFTVFSQETFQFSPGLNVIVGENGMGKSHLLKLAYAVIATNADAGRKPNATEPTKVYLQKAYGEKLIGVFRPESLGRLASRKQGRERCEIALAFSDTTLNTSISFSTAAQSDVQIDHLPTRWESESPLYLPTRELLTIYPGFVSVYENHYLAFEETWRDTCVHLGALALKGPREKQAALLLKPIEDALGGKVVLDNNGRFYLSIAGSGNMEMPLVSEGFRKLAMLARLIANGVVREQGYLFWDEPEANLNPRLIRLAAQVIHALCQRGVQVFIASHSFFLLKELDMLAKKDPISQRFISLSRGAEAPEINVDQADSLSQLGNIVALDEELAQYDREMEMTHD
jgi:ABC-type transport system involved in cytochrome c biogenesis ATPase subunit